MFAWVWHETASSRWKACSGAKIFAESLATAALAAVTEKNWWTILIHKNKCSSFLKFADAGQPVPTLSSPWCPELRLLSFKNPWFVNDCQSSDTSITHLTLENTIGFSDGGRPPSFQIIPCSSNLDVSLETLRSLQFSTHISRLSFPTT